MEKTALIVAIAVIAVALIVVLVVYVSKVGKAMEQHDYELARRVLDIVRAIAITIAVAVGGTAVSTFFSSCVAKRSITVQGTVIQSSTSDSTRIIISSQESYTGVKK